MIKVEHIVKEFNSLKAVNDVSLEIKKSHKRCMGDTTIRASLKVYNYKERKSKKRFRR